MQIEANHEIHNVLPYLKLSHFGSAVAERTNPILVLLHL
jgi:hypothetical protein